MYNNIMAEIARLGLSKTKVAKELGMNRNTFHFKIVGKYDWKLEELNRLLIILKKSVLYLTQK